MPSPNEYRALAEEASRSVVAARSSGASNLFKLGIPLLALGFVAWMIYTATRAPSPGSITRSDKEDFKTTQFPAPSIDTPRPQLDNGTIVVVPPAPEPVPAAPPQPPTTIEAPPPIPAALPPPSAGPPDDSEARRLAEEERRRVAEEERRKWERLRAGQLVQDQGSQGDARSAANGATADPENKEDDPNRRFLARAGSSGAEISIAIRNKRIDALVAQGTMIKGVLETAIQSDLAGQVRAVVSENVWSFDGRRILIPAGSRLIGEYRSGLAIGQTRVFVVWGRMLRSDGVSVQLGSTGTDSLGRTGMPGEVDNHYFQRFGAAVMLSVVGGAAQYIANVGGNSGSTQGATYVDPVTGQTIVTQPNQNQIYAQQIGAQQISQSLNRIAEEALRNSINIPPTIHVDQGSRIMVFVKRDLDFSAMYPDPVKEALQDIRRERAAHRLSR